MNALSLPSVLDRAEQAIKQHPKSIDPSSVPLQHMLTDSGVYAREMYVPAGMVIAGKAKRAEYITFLLAGYVTEISEEGKRQIKAPCMFKSL